jgi:hypothetical protein
MSSGISIEERRLDDRFQPSHFFVLGSLLLATVTVFVTRRSGPEHLILLSLTVGAAGAVAAALYRTLLPLISDTTATSEGPLSERRRAALEREKMLVLRTIKELEFDRAMDKLSQKDFDEMSGRLRRRALALMKQLDDGVQYREIIERDLRERQKGRLKTASTDDGRGQAQSACRCGTINDPDAVFCKKCGTRLQEG